MKEIVNCILLFFFPLFIQAQFVGNVDVGQSSGKAFLYDINAYLFPGEKAIFSVANSSAINVNPYLDHRDECTKLFGFKLKCKRIEFVVNGWSTPSQYPVELSLFDKTANKHSQITQSSNTAEIIVPLDRIANFGKSFQPNGYIPTQNKINRGPSYGTYKVSMKVDTKGRLNYLPEYLDYLYSQGGFSQVAVNNVLNKNFKKQYAAEIADILLDFINAHSSEAGMKTELKKVATLASSELAPNNAALKVKLGDFFLSDLRFQKAKDTLTSAIKLITINKNINQLNTEELDQVGKAYSLLGNAFAKETMGVDKMDLTQAERYFDQSIEHYEKVANYEKVQESILERTKVLKKINTQQSLAEATRLMRHYKKLWTRLLPYRDDAGKFGYIDIDGQVILPAEYEAVFTFDETTKLAAAQKNGKWGVISKTGKVIIDFIHNDAVVFSEFLSAPYFEKNRMGFLDQTGRKLTSAIYQSLTQWSKDSENANEGSSEALNSYYCYSPFFPIINPDPKPEQIGDPLYDLKKREIKEQSDFAENSYGYGGRRAYNLLKYKENDKWGIVNEKGTVIVEPAYDLLIFKSNLPYSQIEFPEGQYEAESLLGFFRKDNKGGILNGKGKLLYEVVIPGNVPTNILEFDRNMEFIGQEGNVLYFKESKNNGKRGIVKIEKGVKSIAVEHRNRDEIYIEIGGAVYLKEGEFWSLYSDFGQTKEFTLKCDELFPGEGDYHLAVKRDKGALVQKDGTILTDFIYDNIDEFDEPSSIIDRRISQKNLIPLEASIPPLKDILIPFQRGGVQGLMNQMGVEFTKLVRKEDLILLDYNYYTLSDKSDTVTIYNGGNEKMYEYVIGENENLKIDQLYPFNILKINVRKLVKQTGSDEELDFLDEEEGIEFVDHTYFVDVEEKEELLSVQGAVIKKKTIAGEKWGVLDYYSDDYLLAPTYDSIIGYPEGEDFVSKLYKIKKDNKWGLFKSKGGWCFQIEYDQLEIIPECISSNQIFGKDYTLASIYPNFKDLKLLPKSLLKNLYKFALAGNIPDIFWFVKGDKCGYISKTGKLIWEGNYSN